MRAGAKEFYPAGKTGLAPRRLQHAAKFALADDHQPRCGKASGQLGEGAQQKDTALSPLPAAPHAE